MHALLGENGAGKTTLLSILAGFIRPDAGEIAIDGAPLPLGSPRASIERGIGLCAQHFLLASALTAAENILLGRPGCGGWGPPPRSARERIERLARENRLEVPLDRPVAELSVAEQERTEILKLLMRDSRILVLDEPTAVLAPTEVETLFATLRGLADQGRTILLVTHRLSEVQQVADAVTVLRRGRVVGEGDPRALGRATLVEWIAGRRPPDPPPRRRRPPGEPLLDLRRFAAGTGPSAPARIDLSVREGEIVGIGGVLGNGQEEIIGALTGRMPLAGGSARLLGQSVAAPGRLALPAEVAWIPEDRRGEGLALEMTCEENLRIGLPRGTEPRGEQARRRLEEFDVRPADPSLRVAQLSGGNQQRLLLARELARPTRLLLAVHPTRGLDPTAALFVHERLLAAREEGVGILLVTGDLDELRLLSDRIVILYRGEIRYEAAGEEAEPEAIHRALLGVG